MIGRIYVELHMTLLQGFVVSDTSLGFCFRDFIMYFHYKPMEDDVPGRSLYEPYRHGWHCYTQIMIVLGLVVLEILCLSHCKSMGANDPWGGGHF